MYETVLILDFGGQYKELIARRVRECGVYSVIRPGNIAVDDVLEYKPVGMILTGGPQSVYKADAPKCDKRLFELGVPVLGICYGMQLMSSLLGGVIQPCRVSEYGKTKMDVDTLCPLFSGLDSVQTGLMSHTDSVVVLPDGFIAVASRPGTPSVRCAVSSRGEQHSQRYRNNT